MRWLSGMTSDLRIERRCREAVDDAGMHRCAGAVLCGAGGRPRRHAPPFRLHHADVTPGRGVRPQIDGRRHSRARHRGDPDQFRHRDLSQARQQCAAREGAGRSQRTLLRTGAPVLEREWRAAGDHAGRRDAAHPGGRRQRPGRQVPRARGCERGRHSRLRLAGRSAAHGGLRRAADQGDPLLQSQPGAPRSLLHRDERAPGSRGRAGGAAGGRHRGRRHHHVRDQHARQRVLRALDQARHSSERDQAAGDRDGGTQAGRSWWCCIPTDSPRRSST